MKKKEKRKKKASNKIYGIRLRLKKKEHIKIKFPPRKDKISINKKLNKEIKKNCRTTKNGKKKEY